MSGETILKYLIDNDLLDHKKYMVSHHIVENPNRIDVKPNDVVYIDKITINPDSSTFWLEFHSATDSRIVQSGNYEQITRHKGNIYFNTRHIKKFRVSFVKLKLIK